MRRSSVRGWLLAVGCVFVLGGCPGRRGGGGGGGDDDDASCDFAACGGDPVGDWSIVDSCVNYDASPPDDCPEADVSYGEIDLTGTLAVDADGTYVMDMSMDFAVTIDFPSSCLGGASCDLVEQSLVDSFPGSSCPDSARGCRCTSPISESTNETGTWEVNGNTLRVVDEDGDAQDMDLCASAGSMQIRSEEGPSTLEMIFEPR